MNQSKRERESVHQQHPRALYSAYRRASGLQSPAAVVSVVAVVVYVQVGVSTIWPSTASRSCSRSWSAMSNAGACAENPNAPTLAMFGMKVVDCQARKTSRVGRGGMFAIQSPIRDNLGATGKPSAAAPTLPLLQLNSCLTWIKPTSDIAWPF
jgi:hypothetical protein